MTNTLEKLVKDELHIYMTKKEAPSRTESLFVSYKLHLCRHGLAWLTKDNEKVAVYHVLSAIRPELLHTILKYNFHLLHYKLSKEFKGFIPYAIK